MDNEEETSEATDALFSPLRGGARFLFIRAKNDMIPLQHRKHRIQTFLVNTLFLQFPLPDSRPLILLFFYHFNSSSTFCLSTDTPTRVDPIQIIYTSFFFCSCVQLARLCFEWCFAAFLPEFLVTGLDGQRGREKRKKLGAVFVPPGEDEDVSKGGLVPTPNQPDEWI